MPVSSTSRVHPTQDTSDIETARVNKKIQKHIINQNAVKLWHIAYSYSYIYYNLWIPNKVSKTYILRKKKCLISQINSVNYLQYL